MWISCICLSFLESSRWSHTCRITIEKKKYQNQNQKKNKRRKKSKIPLPRGWSAPAKWTFGLACERIAPGVPNDFLTSVFMLPLNKMVPFPSGDWIANSSKVKTFPSFSSILFLAASVTCNAQTCIFFGISNILISLVMVPTMTIMLEANFSAGTSFTILLKVTGLLWRRDWHNLL